MPAEIERLYREHRASLVRLVERELRDHQDAEDVVQTAFLDAQRALERGTVPRNPPAWLTSIALNAARRFRRRRLNAEPLVEYAAPEPSRMPEIRAALTSLPSEQRTAVLYRDVVGLSYGETAEQMGTSVNAVTMLLHRGRQRLRQTLGITTGGGGLWRGLRRAGMPQAAAAKGATAVVVAAGLATAGSVTARAVAPIGTGMTVAVAGPSGALIAGARPAPRGAVALHRARRHRRTTDGSSAGSAPGLLSTQAAGGSTASAPSEASSTLRAPVLSAPTLPLPTSATVTASTPVATVTATVPLSTTVAVTTPLTTVTVPVP